ncbi:MAG: hypothetical protein AAGF12_07790 [Myxococcota bacterium]
MDARPHVLILSKDPVLRGLLGHLLGHERFCPSEASSMEELRACCTQPERAPELILLDAVDSGELAQELLADAWRILGDVQPPLVVLAGSTTDATVTDHAFIDRVLWMPISSETLLDQVRYHLTVRPRRAMSSGVQIRVPASESDDSVDDVG